MLQEGQFELGSRLKVTYKAFLNEVFIYLALKTRHYLCVYNSNYKDHSGESKTDFES